MTNQQATQARELLLRLMGCLFELGKVFPTMSEEDILNMARVVAVSPVAPAKKPVKKAPAKKAAPPKPPVKKAPAKKAAPPKPPVKKAPAKKPAPVKKPMPNAKGVDNPLAAKGREEVRAGLRPRIKDAMTQVMGDKTMNSEQITERLHALGWLPSANDPRGYVAYLLSSFKDRFERMPEVGRGFYRVKKAFQKVAKAAPATPLQ